MNATRTVQLTLRKTLLRLGWLVLSAMPMASVAEVSPELCGPIYVPGAFGPYDYRYDKDKLYIVERAHFTSEVEMLVRGHSTALIGTDLNYTLSKYPNHHRALLAMLKLGQKLKTEQAPGADYPVECYFERALRFKRNDTVSRLLYVQYLISKDRRSEALEQTAEAARFAAENALTHFNVGLSYFELKAYDRALQHAHQAQKLGYANTALIDKLKAVGQWREPEPEAAPQAESDTADAPASAASAP